MKSIPIDVPLAAKEHFAKFKSEVNGIIGEREAFGVLLQSVHSLHQSTPPLRCGREADATADECEQPIDIGVRPPEKLDVVDHDLLRRQRWKIVFA